MVATESPALVDLNADLGEGVGDDEAMLAVVTSASIACGGHAGGERSMLQACRLAARHGVVIGAHPSYPDREGFGRRALTMAAEDLLETVREQVAGLESAAQRAGAEVRYLKPHGALYHAVLESEETARVVLRVAAERPGGPVPLLTRPGAGARLAPEFGVTCVMEGFADRGLDARGDLLPRSEPGAVLHEPAEVLAQVPRLLGQVRSVCVHGDTPGAVRLALAVRERLTDSGASLAPFA